MMTMVISGSDGVTFPDSTNQFSGGAFSFKNRIINGDMRIDQRNAGAAVTASGDYPVDRFIVTNTTNAAFSAQQDSSAPEGFNKSLKLTITTAQTNNTGNAQVIHRIEGTNIADLGWGTANAKTITVSFWVRSSLTGTFGGYLRNSGGTRSYPFTYSISSADTWEYKTVAVSGDTSGTWLTDNSLGVQLSFSLFAVSSSQQTAGSWYAGNATGATGQTQLASTLNATWYITGVQLEVGSVSTPFERRPFGAELVLCMRYFETSGSGGSQTLAIAASSRIPAYFAVAKRAAPTLVYSFAAGSNTVSLDVPTTGGFRMNNSAGGSVSGPCDFTWTASAEL
jgi:hypothetical protein